MNFDFKWLGMLLIDSFMAKKMEFYFIILLIAQKINILLKTYH